MSPVRDILLSGNQVLTLVDGLADEIAPRTSDETVVVCLLTGGLWFAADLMRALARRGRHPIFDAMWLSSYGDAHASSGVVTVRAGLQRPVEGRQVLLLDDVLDSGRSLASAVQTVKSAAAAEALTAVFARKPWPEPRMTPDFIAWEAPDRFLVGYGMDDAGRYRGLPGIEAI